MIQKMAILLSVLLAIICLIIGAWFYLEWKDTHGNPFNSYSYMTDKAYDKAVKVPFSSSYEAYQKSEIGQDGITEITVKNGRKIVTSTHPGIIYRFVHLDGKPDEDENYVLRRVTITSPSYKLGRRKIHVGSTRAEVERAYRKAPDCYWEEGMGDGYIDGYGIYVRFLYDENDVVTQITLRLE